jgi:hypothetical protein
MSKQRYTPEFKDEAARQRARFLVKRKTCPPPYERPFWRLLCGHFVDSFSRHQKGFSANSPKPLE